MVLSGCFTDSTTYYLRCQWKGVQNIEEGYTNITMDVYAIDPWKSDAIWIINVTLEDVFESFTSSVTNESKLVGTLKTQVKHKADGSRSITMSGSIGPLYTDVIRFGSATFDLDIISGLKMECTISSITYNGFDITAQSSHEADQWSYSLNGGNSWTSIPNIQGLEARVNLSYLKDNNPFAVQIQGRNVYNHIFGYSKVISVKTLQKMRSCYHVPSYCFGLEMLVKCFYISIMSN